MIVVSDVCLLREGVGLALARDERLEVVGTSGSPEAEAAVAAHHPDVVVLDAGMTDGRGMLRLLKARNVDLRVVVFAIADGDADIVGWAEAGTDGHVGRDGTAEDLALAVEGAMRGETFCSPRLTGLLFARIAELSESMSAARDDRTLLTQREQEIMDCIDQALSNKEIARRLGIGHATVKNHVHRILEKLHARGRGEAAARIRRSRVGAEASRSRESD